MKSIILILIFLCSGVASAQIISEVIVEGNKKTRTSFIRKITKVQEGKPVDTLLIAEDITRLKRLPGIAHAFYTLKKEGETCQVIFTVEENFTILPSANVFTTQDDEFAYRLALYEFNGLGRNIVFGGFYQRDIYNSFGINFRAPYLFNNKAGIALNFQDFTTLEPVFLENGTADYKYNNLSYEILGLFEFDFDNRIELGFNYFIEDYKYKKGATSPDVPQALRANKRLIKFIYEYNRVEFFYYFVEGFKSILNFQYVQSNDQNLPSFVIGFNDFIYYLRVGDKGNWATRLRLGLATNNETPFAPFALDNNLNIRGVGNTIDRGTGAIVLNTEYRYTLFEKNWFVFQGNTFLDVGSWRNPGGDFGDFVELQNLRIYPGLGVRFIHKKIFNTIFRIDYGVGISEKASNGFVIGIGQYF